VVLTVLIETVFSSGTMFFQQIIMRLFLLALARLYNKIIKNVADCLPGYRPASDVLLLIQAVEEENERVD
jgi:hypothetical protein